MSQDRANYVEILWWFEKIPLPNEGNKGGKQSLN
jgi:hypothetical protein